MQESKLITAAIHEKHDKIARFLKKPVTSTYYLRFWPRVIKPEEKQIIQKKHAEEVVAAFNHILKKYQAPTLEKNKAKTQEKRYRSLIQLFCYLCRYYPQALDHSVLDNLLPNPAYQHITASPSSNPMCVAFHAVHQHNKIDKSLTPALLNIIEQLSAHCWWRQIQNEKKLYKTLSDKIENPVYRAYHKGKVPYTEAFKFLNSSIKKHKELALSKQLNFLQLILIPLLSQDLAPMVISFCHSQEQPLTTFLDDSPYTNILDQYFNKK